VKALLLLAAALPAIASEDPQEARGWVDLPGLEQGATILRDSVADPRSSAVKLKNEAASQFDHMRNPVAVNAYYRRVEREAPTGELTTVEGLQKTAERRVEIWRARFKETPPPEIVDAVKKAKSMRDEERLDFDRTGSMPENQMGSFHYAVDSLTGGSIHLNQMLRLLGAMLGEAFVYATVAHEAQHAADREAGLLGPDRVLEGEIRAFKTQYRWLKLFDPLGERIAVAHSTLTLKMRRKPDPLTKRALDYLDHLYEVLATEGKDEEIRKLVKRMGYEERGHKHHHDPSPRASRAPLSA
jgi:hypothetical protein